VLRLVDQAHWAEGWLHQLTGRRPRPAAADDLDAIAFLLGEVLADWSQGAAEAVAQNRANGHPAPTTAEITRSLTRAVLSTTDDEVFAPLARYLRPYRELRVPVVPNGKGRYGRLDVVIWLPGGPDIVVEIRLRPEPGLRAEAHLRPRRRGLPAVGLLRKGQHREDRRRHGPRPLRRRRRRA
jgi:hypothetical protein